MSIGYMFDYAGEPRYIGGSEAKVGSKCYHSILGTRRVIEHINEIQAKYNDEYIGNHSLYAKLIQSTTSDVDTFIENAF